MAKTITITHDNKQYTLEYSRTTASMIEQQGFDTDLITTKPVTMTTLLFYGAFAKNHPSMKREKMEKIFDSLGKRGELLKTLVEMYMETANVLVDDEDNDGNEGNAGWGANE